MPVINKNKHGQTKYKEYTDLTVMFKDIRDHIRKHGKGHIIPCDDPARLILGYICRKTDIGWAIEVKNLRAPSSIRSYMNSIKGRVDILNDLEKII